LEFTERKLGKPQINQIEKQNENEEKNHPISLKLSL
jgi:hypothetical protein